MDFINGIFSKAGEFILGVVKALPKSPFTFVEPTEFKELMGYINYFIPFGAMAKIMATWLVAVSVWYFVSWGLRNLNAIE